MAKYLVQRGGVVLPNGMVLDTGAEFDSAFEKMSDADVARYMAAKKIVPASAGTLPTHTPLFVLLLIGVVLLVGALTFVPALALGPVVEQLHMLGIP